MSLSGWFEATVALTYVMTFGLVGSRSAPTLTTYFNFCSAIPCSFMIMRHLYRRPVISQTDLDQQDICHEMAE